MIELDTLYYILLETRPMNSKIITMRMDAELAAWAKSEAHRRETTLSAMMRDILERRRKAEGKQKRKGA